MIDSFSRNTSVVLVPIQNVYYCLFDYRLGFLNLRMGAPL